MDERERAAYYDAHRAEPQEFIEAAQTPAERKRDALRVTVAVRFSAPEAEMLAEIARIEGKTYSEVIRTAMRRYAPAVIAITPGRTTLTIFDNERAGQNGLPDQRTLVNPFGQSSVTENRAAHALKAE